MKAPIALSCAAFKKTRIWLGSQLAATGNFNFKKVLKIAF
jgi:hypothetical protein